jgi:hypothetical protein
MSCVNGIIPMTIRLGCAIRFFAGGDANDIHLALGISYSKVFYSVNYITDAVNLTECLDIVFPKDHAVQEEIAAGFKAKSDANFDGCAGCIDGLLVWMHKPTKKECEATGVGQIKYLCGRKSKYGLNLQAICDHKRRFLDVSILFGGSTSDLLAFEASPIRETLAEEGFLAPGLCMFGDNAYVNQFFMATPYPNVRMSTNHEKDAYNFYHSQLRINIECAFGMLVARWGFLKKKTPEQYTVKKTVAVVSCLCKLHNFLINQGCKGPPACTGQDELNFAVSDSVQADEVARGQDIGPRIDLIGGGEHFDDDPERVVRRRLAKIVEKYGEELPRECMFIHVVTENLRRPERNLSRNRQVP